MKHPRPPFPTRVLAFVGLMLLSLAAPPAAAQSQQGTERHSFDITLLGIRAASLTFTAREAQGQYRVEGTLQSQGAATAIRRLRYEGTTVGQRRGDRYLPQTYAEETDTGKRQSAAVMRYKDGVPQVAEHRPPRPARAGDLDPATQGGTVDPLTAVFATLRDVDATRACTLSLVIFDGRRRSRVTLSDPQPAGDGLRCTGEYRRLAGFSADDMAERSRFPFTLQLSPVGEGRLRVVEVQAETLFGRAVLRRP